MKINQKLGVKINFAVVLRCDIKTVEDIKLFLRKHPDIQVIYNCTSGSKLFVLPEDKLKKIKEDKANEK